jgi:hypothetical protein
MILFITEQNMKKCKPQNFSLVSPVSLTPLINIHSRISLLIFEVKKSKPPKWGTKRRGEN